MDEQELQHLLRENLKIAKENKALLVKLHSYQRFQRTAKMVYWVFMIALAFGAYYYAKPYIDNVNNAYTSIRESFGAFSGTMNGFSL